MGRKELFFILMMATCFSTHTLFNNHISAEDKEEIAALNKNIAILEPQESDEEYFAYLNDNRSFIHSMIKRMNLLMRKYPNNPSVESFREAHNYLKSTMARFGL